ncbi:hypothetical protein U3516DRAFT_673294 [Neocallimastix sp. 'constans']
MSSNKIKENDYEKATLMAKEIAALGRRDTKFFRWKMEVEDIFEDLSLSEKEKKKIVILATYGKTKDRSIDIYYENKDLSLSDFISKIGEPFSNSKISNTNLHKLEALKISKYSVTEFNKIFKELLLEMSERDKPNEERLIFLYKKACKKRTPVFNELLTKQPKSLKDAYDIVLKVEETIEPYVSDDEYDSTQFNRIPKRRSFNRRKQNNLSEDKFNKVEKDRKKIDKDIQESDLEALTKSFAEMKIHGSSQSSRRINKIDSSFEYRNKNEHNNHKATAYHHGEKSKVNHYHNYPEAPESDTTSSTDESEEKSNNYNSPHEDLLNKKNQIKKCINGTLSYSEALKKGEYVSSPRGRWHFGLLPNGELALCENEFKESHIKWSNGINYLSKYDLKFFIDINGHLVVTAKNIVKSLDKNDHYDEKTNSITKENKLNKRTEEKNKDQVSVNSVEDNDSLNKSYILEYFAKFKEWLKNYKFPENKSKIYEIGNVIQNVNYKSDKEIIVWDSLPRNLTYNVGYFGDSGYFLVLSDDGSKSKNSPVILYDGAGVKIWQIIPTDEYKGYPFPREYDMPLDFETTTSSNTLTSTTPVVGDIPIYTNLTSTTIISINDNITTKIDKITTKSHKDIYLPS